MEIAATMNFYAIASHRLQFLDSLRNEIGIEVERGVSVRRGDNVGGSGLLRHFGHLQADVERSRSVVEVVEQVTVDVNHGG